MDNAANDNTSVHFCSLESFQGSISQLSEEVINTAMASNTVPLATKQLLLGYLGNCIQRVPAN